MVLMIDNHDSFTWNLVQYLRELGAEVRVVQNDEYTYAQLAAMQPQALVVSPGPCTPNEAGVSLEAVARFADQIPILGVCLGHQVIGQVFGGHVTRAKSVMHGKTSQVHHDGSGVFAGLPSTFTVTRYHSLVIDPHNVPRDLMVSAWTEDAQGQREEIMGIRHRRMDIQGVQFHPESVMTEHGHALLKNFLDRLPDHDRRPEHDTQTH